MKKQIILIIFALTLFLSLNLISAEIQFSQQKFDLGNGTIKNHLSLVYSKGTFGIASDYVTGNNPYEVYLLYNIYPKQFNQNNPLQKVSYCEWIIYYWAKSSANAVIVLDVNYTDATDDILNGKYFMKLYDGDSMMADQICKYQDNSFNELSLPAEMQMVTASWECKACQYYEWSVQNKDVVKAKSIGANIVVVSDYIKKLFNINFEIWLSLFWIFLILMIFVALGFLFLSVYWLYKYLSGVMK